MLVKWLRMLGIAVVVVIAAGCADPLPPTGASLRPGDRHPLPLANWTMADGRTLLCAGGGHVASGWTLHGSPDDPRLAWMIQPDGVRLDLAFPAGWTARFRPMLEVLDPDGTTVAREGSEISAHCVTAERGVVMPEFEAAGPP